MKPARKEFFRASNRRAMFRMSGMFLLLVSSLYSQPQKFQLNGEYGLWIQRADNNVNVHWITAAKDSGLFRAFVSGEQIFEVTTPASYGHRAAFSTDAENLSIRYGSLSHRDDIHETEIYLGQAPVTKAKSVFSKVDSIYVLGDIHGEFDRLTNLLLKAGFINSELNWSGNKRHIVALGDIFDRGHDVTRTLWFLYKLERQAAQTGGMVHVILGNHEIMIFSNDLRYLSGKERLIATTHDANYAEMYSPRTSLLGQWLARKPALLKIDSALFAHGGVTPPYTALSIEAINDSVEAFLQEDVFYSLLQGSVPAGVDSSKFYNRLAFFYADDSIFWHRGYVSSNTLKDDLKKVLKAFKAKVQVIAHTPVQSIRTFYDGKVIAVDLNKPATEMLLLVRDGKNKFKRFKVTLEGAVEPI